VSKFAETRHGTKGTIPEMNITIRKKMERDGALKTLYLAIASDCKYNLFWFLFALINRKGRFDSCFSTSWVI
jgi:hypothetical protein